MDHISAVLVSYDLQVPGELSGQVKLLNYSVQQLQNTLAQGWKDLLIPQNGADVYRMEDCFQYELSPTRP